MTPDRHIAWLTGSAATLALALLGPVAAGEAARAPTLDERAAITQALPAFVRSYPADCVRLIYRVSRNGRFATVTPRFLDATHPPCVRYASNGEWILAWSRSWKVVYNGSELPSCSLGVPRDLTIGPCKK